MSRIKGSWMKITFLAMGIASTVWFLVRNTQAEGNVSVHAHSGTDNVGICDLPPYPVWHDCGIQESKAQFQAVKLQLWDPFRSGSNCRFSIFPSQRTKMLMQKVVRWVIMPNQPVGVARIFPDRLFGFTTGVTK
jgi:hypothetical protein